MPVMVRLTARPQGLTQLGRTVTAAAVYTDYVSDTGRAFVRIENGIEESWWRVESAPPVAA